MKRNFDISNGDIVIDGNVFTLDSIVELEIFQRSALIYKGIVFQRFPKDIFLTIWETLDEREQTRLKKKGRDKFGINFKVISNPH